MEKTHIIYKAFNKSPPQKIQRRSLLPYVNFQNIHKGISTMGKKLRKKTPRISPYQKTQKTKFVKMVKDSDTCLLRISTVFPFDLFPDEVSIDPEKVNIITREFFFSEDIHSIMIKNIKDISIETNIFFATLKIIPDVYVGHAVEVPFLKKTDAIHARRIIQGLIVSEKEGVDATQIVTQERLTHELEKLGALSGIEQKLSPLLPPQYKAGISIKRR